MMIRCLSAHHAAVVTATNITTNPYPTRPNFIRHLKKGSSARLGPSCETHAFICLSGARSADQTTVPNQHPPPLCYWERTCHEVLAMCDYSPEWAPNRESASSRRPLFPSRVSDANHLPWGCNRASVRP